MTIGSVARTPASLRPCPREVAARSSPSSAAAAVRRTPRRRSAPCSRPRGRTKSALPRPHAGRPGRRCGSPKRASAACSTCSRGRSAPRASAVLADGHDRRVAVAVAPGEDPEAAEALAAWLDAGRTARSPRGPRWPAAPATGRRLVASVPVRSEAAAQADRRDEPHFACLEPLPAGSATRAGLRLRRMPSRPTDCETRFRRPRSPRRRPRWRWSTEQLAIERELATLRARDEERTRYVSTVAHELRTPLTGLARVPRADPRRQGRGPSRGARVPRARAGTSWRRWASSSATCSSCPGSNRARCASRSAPFSVAEVGGRVVGGLAPIALDRGDRASSRPAAAAPRGDRRPPTRRADPHEPRRQRAEVRARPGALVELAAGSTARSPSSRPRRRRRDRRRGPGPDLRALLPDGRPRAGHRHRPRPADRARPRPGDGRRPRRRVGRRVRVQPSCSSCRAGGRSTPTRRGGPRAGARPRRRSRSRSGRCCAPSGRPRSGPPATVAVAPRGRVGSARRALRVLEGPPHRPRLRAIDGAPARASTPA